MHKIEDFADQRNKSWCIHCARWLNEIETNEDHVPSRSLLQQPRPHHLPKVTVCKRCNSGFSKDEQYLTAFLSAVRSGSTDPLAQLNASAARSLARSPKLRNRIAQSSVTYHTVGGETRVVWKPEIERIKRVILKNARGHAYYELGEPMLNDPVYIWLHPLEALKPTERREFETPEEGSTFLPEVGSRMLTRLLTGEDLSGPWIVVQEGTYRYAICQSGGIHVKSVLSEYLATEVYWTI